MGCPNRACVRYGICNCKSTFTVECGPLQICQWNVCAYQGSLTSAAAVICVLLQRMCSTAVTAAGCAHQPCLAPAQNAKKAAC